MARVAARTAAELAAGVSADVTVTPGDPGVLVLGSKNLAPNPDLKDFTPGPLGDPAHLILGAPPQPTGWNVYARRRRGVAGSRRGTLASFATRQNSAPLPLTRTSYRETGPLVRGAGIPTGSSHIAAPPRSPRIERVSLSGKVGYAAGTYAAYIAYGVGNPRRPWTLRYTEISPGVTFSLNAGQGARFYLPDRVPEGVTVLALVMGEVSSEGSEQQALVADAWLQHVQDIREGIPEVRDLWGPYEKRRRFSVDPVSNQTFVAGANRYGRPRVSVRHGAYTLQPMRTRFSYSYKTQYGYTPAQRQSGWFKITHPTRNRRAFWAPRRFPPGVTAWRPEFIGADGNWYALADHPVGRQAYIYTHDPEEFPGRYKPRKIERRAVARQDESGIPGPDGAPDAPVAIGRSQLAPGTYEVRTSWSVDSLEGSLESAPSPPATVTLPETAPGSGVSNYTFLVHRPPAGNLIANPELVDRNRGDPGTPEHWTTFSVNGVAQSISAPGVGRSVDTSGATTSDKVRETDPIYIDSTRPHTVRTKLRVSNHTGGQFRVRVQQLDANFNLLASETFGALSANGEGYFDTSLGALSPIRYQDGVRYLRLSYAHWHIPGSVRGFTGEFSHSLVVEGPTPLLKRDPDAVIAGGEEPAEPYPAGGYCVVVEDPPNDADARPADLVTEDRQSRNLLTYNQSSAEEGTVAGIQAYGTGSPHPTQEEVLDGEYSFKAVAERGGGTYGLQTSSVGLPGGPSAGTTYTFQLRMLDPTGARRARAGISWRDANDEFISADTSELTTTSAGDTAHELSVTAQAPQNAASALLHAAITDGLSGEHFFVDRLQFKADSEATLWEPGGVRVPRDGSVRLNKLEYFGPIGTPARPEHGATGYRTPVKEGSHYTVSAYLKWGSVTVEADVFVAAVKNAAGETLFTLPPLAAGLGRPGREYRSWGRQALQFDAPAGSAYLELVSGGCSDGRVELMGFQVEESFGATPFTAANALSGTNVVTLDTAVPGLGAGMPLADYYRPEDAAWVEAGVIATLDDRAQTTVTTRFRSSTDLVAFSGWSPDIAGVPGGPRRYLQIETTLSTDDPTRSPEAREPYLELRRKLPALLRADGSEFDGGVVVDAIPALHEEPNIQETLMADNSPRIREFGSPRRWLRGVTLIALLDSTAREIAAGQQGKRDFILEGFPGGPSAGPSVVTEQLSVRLGKVSFDTRPRRGNVLRVPGVPGVPFYVEQRATTDLEVIDA